MNTKIQKPPQTVKDITIPKGTSFNAPQPQKREKGVCFPLHVLPERCQELIAGCERDKGMPPGFLASSMLYAVSAAMGITRRLSVKGGQYETGLLYLALVGNPNSNKSAPLKFALKPILDSDSDSYASYQLLRSEFEANDALSKAEKKEGGISETDAPPIFSRKLVQDVTPEKLISIHEDNLRGIASYRDELAGWLKDFGRYAKGSEEEFWLSNWSCTPVSVDRVSSAPRRISTPFISVCGTIQPGVLEIFSGDGRAANGFLDRVLFVWPEGLTKPLWTTDEMGPDLYKRYAAAINRLQGLQHHDDDGGLIYLSLEARKRLFSDYFNGELKPLCDKANEDGKQALSGMMGKLDIYTLRFSLLLHAILWAYSDEPEMPTEISTDTVDKAITLSRYFRGETMKVHDVLFDGTPFDKMTGQQQKVYQALPSHFTRAEGVDIAVGMGMAQRTFCRLIQKKELFERPKTGEYLKLL